MKNIDVAKDNLTQGHLGDISYQTFSNMASFYGRFMESHHHLGYYQLHYLNYGYINISLDNKISVTTNAPLFVLTPPSVSHAFFTPNEATGHVLTVRDAIIEPILKKLYPRPDGNVSIKAVCISLEQKQDVADNIERFFEIIASSINSTTVKNEVFLQEAVQALFAYIFCIKDMASSINARKYSTGDLGIFQEFTKLIESNYTKHLTVVDYVTMLGITESKLKEVCKKVSALPPKRMIFERLLQEAKRQLVYTDHCVSSIADNLGFEDSSYFTRFFGKHVGVTPTQWRKESKLLTNIDVEKMETSSPDVK